VFILTVLRSINIHKPTLISLLHLHISFTPISATNPYTAASIHNCQTQHPGTTTTCLCHFCHNITNLHLLTIYIHNPVTKHLHTIFNFQANQSATTTQHQHLSGLLQTVHTITPFTSVPLLKQTHSLPVHQPWTPILLTTIHYLTLSITQAPDFKTSLQLLYNTIPPTQLAFISIPLHHQNNISFPLAILLPQHTYTIFTIQTTTPLTILPCNIATQPFIQTAHKLLVQTPPLQYKVPTTLPYCLQYSPLISSNSPHPYSTA